MMSMTDAPARNGWPGGPVMNARPGLELHDFIERRTMLVRPGEIAFQRQVITSRGLSAASCS